MNAPDFVDECDFSETGFALWKWDGEVRYCTCIARPRPEGWISDEPAETPPPPCISKKKKWTKISPHKVS